MVLTILPLQTVKGLIEVRNIDQLPFYENDQEQEMIQDYIALWLKEIFAKNRNRGKTLEKFYFAEEYHQDYENNLQIHMCTVFYSTLEKISKSVSRTTQKRALISRKVGSGSFYSPRINEATDKSTCQCTA